MLLAAVLLFRAARLPRRRLLHPIVAQAKAGAGFDLHS